MIVLVYYVRLSKNHVRNPKLSGYVPSLRGRLYRFWNTAGIWKLRLMLNGTPKAGQERHLCVV